MAEARGARIPVHAVAMPAAGRVIAERVALEAASLGLVRMPQRALPNLVPLPPGCPCCTGRVALEIALARYVRDRRPARVYIEVPDPAHAAQLAAILRREPLARYLEEAGALSPG